MSAVATKGVLRLRPESELNADFHLSLAYDGQPPERLQLRLHQSDRDAVIEVPVSTVSLGEGGLEAIVHVGNEHGPFRAIKVFTASTHDGVPVEANYGEEYSANNLFFFSDSDFERNFYVRRRRGKDDGTLLFVAEQLCLFSERSPAHRAVASVVYAYRTMEMDDRWRAARAFRVLDAVVTTLDQLTLTAHPRTDRAHLVQSIAMARWQLAIFLLDETDLLQTVVQASLRAKQLTSPLAINTYNGCRMLMVTGFLLHKFGRDDAAVGALDAGVALFKAAMINEKNDPNPNWGFPATDVAETEVVVDRMKRFADLLCDGQPLPEQDQVVESATRLLTPESREALRVNFARLVGRIAKAGVDKRIRLPNLAPLASG